MKNAGIKNAVMLPADAIGHRAQNCDLELHAIGYICPNEPQTAGVSKIEVGNIADYLIRWSLIGQIRIISGLVKLRYSSTKHHMVSA